MKLIINELHTTENLNRDTEASNDSHIPCLACE